MEKAGVLGTERRLHIQRRTFQVGEHQHRRPLRDGDTGGKLPHRQGDGLFVVGDGGFYPVKALLVLVRVVQLAVTGGKDHLIVPEYRVHLQLFRQRSGAVHPVQQPEGVLQFGTQLRGGKRKFVLGGHGIQKAVHLGFVFKAAAGLYLKELVQIKGKFLRFAVDLHALLNFVPDDLGHLVGVEVEHGEVCVGVLLPRCALPVPLGGLLVGVGPVEDGIPGKLIVRQRLEGRAGQVQRELAADAVKGKVGLVGVHALVGFVDDQYIPVQLGQVAQLVVLAAEILGAFHVLQADELNALIQFLALCGSIQIALLVQHMGLPGKGIHMADKQIAGLPAQKAHIVAVPAIGNGRAVGDDEHRLCIDLLAEIVDGKGLAKAGLGVPEVFPAGVALVIGLGVMDSPCLFFPQGVGDGGIQLHPAPVHAEILKIPPGLLPIQMEPLVFAVVLHVQLAEVGVEIVVGEHLAAAVIVDGIAPPLLMVQHIGGVGLLFQAFVHRLLGVADLRPAVVPGNFRGGIGVDHGHHLPGSAQGYASHYAISFTWVSINSISSAVRSYLR